MSKMPRKCKGTLDLMLNIELEVVAWHCRKVFRNKIPNVLCV